NETPEDTAALYRDLIKNHWSQRFSEIFEKREMDFAPVPLFGGWKWNDRKRSYDVLMKFAREMRGGPVDFTRFIHRTDMEAVLALTPEQKKAQEEFMAKQREQMQRLFAARTNRATNRPIASATTNRPPHRAIVESLSEP